MLSKPDGSKQMKGFIQIKEKSKISVELEREDWKRVNQVGVSGQINTRYVREMIREDFFEIDCDPHGSFLLLRIRWVYLLRVTTRHTKMKL